MNANTLLNEEAFRIKDATDTMFVDSSNIPMNSTENNNLAVLNIESSMTAIKKGSDEILKNTRNEKKTTSHLNATTSFYKISENFSRKSIAVGLPGRRQAFSLKEQKKSDGGNNVRKLNKTVTIRPIPKSLTKDFENKLNNNCIGKLKLQLKKYLDHNIELAIMTCATLFALFGPDFKAWLNPNYDDIFNGFFILITLLFFIELFVSIWVKNGYIKSFFFWLDLLASLSMLLEINWILFFTLNNLISWSFQNTDIHHKTYFLESKVNNKLINTMQILRIIRLIRIVKLYKAAIIFFSNVELKKKIEKLKKRKQEKERLMKRREEEKRRREERRRRRYEEDEENKKKKTIVGIKKPKRKMTSVNNRMRDYEIAVPKETGMAKGSEPSMLLPRSTLGVESNKPTIDAHQALLQFQQNHALELELMELNMESNISKAASENITKKVIIIILLMLAFGLITNQGAYASDNSSYLFLCKFINNYVAVFGVKNKEYNQTLDNYINENTDPNYPIKSITYNASEIWTNISLLTDPVPIREDETDYAFVPKGLTLIEFSNKKFSRISAWMNICRTIFILFILFYMAVSLVKDLERFVLTPLEAMIDLVDSVARDPINMKNIESLKNRLNKRGIHKLKTEVRTNGIQGTTVQQNSDVKEAEYEMRVIQMAIIKISALLAIGFGEAGGEILRENISSQEGLNPMIAGKKKCAIFGFCDIRHFPDINVALQEKTMVFVNEIADVVHSCVDKFGGSANKNIGDAFLTVWKFPHLEKNIGEEEDDIDPILELLRADQKMNSGIADQAVLGYLSIIKKINKSPTILSYKHNSEIRAKFGDKFRVQMGFGLHVGWAIEGPIGSFYKIDCSYLSPNVNISARLEAATRQYGVSILISGELYDLLSPELKNICRIIDIVTVKGSKTPIRLYTIYVNHNLKAGKKEKLIMSMKEKRKYYMGKKEKLKSDVQKLRIGSVGRLVLGKRGFREMLTDKKRPILFYDKFEEGFKNYIDGNWEKAYYQFKDALFLDSTDGPAKTLYNYIKERNKKAPDNWKGCRELTSK